MHGDPPAPVPGAGGGALLHELPPAALEAMIAAAGAGSGTALIGVEVRHLGGAAADGSPVPAVLDRVAEPFAAFAVGLAADPATRAATEASLAVVAEAFAPWTSTRTLPTLADAPVDAGGDVRRGGRGAAARDRGHVRPGRADRDQPPGRLTPAISPSTSCRLAAKLPKALALTGARVRQ